MLSVGWGIDMESDANVVGGWWRWRPVGATKFALTRREFRLTMQSRFPTHVFLAFIIQKSPQNK
jgi:hypothetical protein